MDVNANIFSNKEITVTYEPSCCVNAGICARQLSEVFRNSVIPWIDLDAARIIADYEKKPTRGLFI